MKKLKKSAKIVLISVVSALCVFAVVFGAILANRKPNNPDTPEIERILTWDEKMDLLEKEINHAGESNTYNVLLGVPYENYLNEATSLSEIGENYFITKMNNFEGFERFYFYSSNSNGSFSVTEITGKKSDGGFGENDAEISLSTYNESIVVIRNGLNDVDVCFSVIDISGNSPKLICTFKSEKLENKTQSIYDNITISKNNKNIFFSIKEFENDSDENYYDISYYILNLVSKNALKVDTYSYDENNEIFYKFNNNVLSLTSNGITKIYVVSNNKTYSYLVSNLGDYIYLNFYSLNEKEVLLEYRKTEDSNNISKNSVISNGKAYNYKYEILSLNNSQNELMKFDYELDDKVADLEIKYYTNFYSILENKVDDKNSYCKGNKITFYYKDGSKVASYEFNSLENEILYLDNRAFVTTSGIYKINSQSESGVIYELGENEIILIQNFVKNKIPICVMKDDELIELKFINHLGETIFELSKSISPETQEKIDLMKINEFLVNNEAYLFQIDKIFYKINFETNSLDVFDESSNDKLLNQVIYNNSSFYFSEFAGNLSLKDFSGKVLIENIKKYEFEQLMNKGLVLQIETNSQKYTLYTNYITLKTLKDDVENYSNVSSYVFDVNPYAEDAVINYNALYVYDSDTNSYIWQYWDFSNGSFLFFNGSQKLVTYKDIDFGKKYKNYTIAVPSGWSFAHWCGSYNGFTEDYSVGYKVKGTSIEVYPVFLQTCKGVVLNSEVEIYTDVLFFGYQYSNHLSYFSDVTLVVYDYCGGNDWEFIGYTSGKKYYDSIQNNLLEVDGSAAAFSYNTSSKLTGDIYFVYRKKITTKYDVNGATYGSVSNKEIYVYGNTSLSFGRVKGNELASSDSISKLGYYFSKWTYNSSEYNSEDLSWCPYSDFKGTTTEFTFKAKWTEATLLFNFIYCQSDKGDLKGVVYDSTSGDLNSLKNLNLKAYYYSNGDKYTKNNFGSSYNSSNYESGKLTKIFYLKFSDISLSNMGSLETKYSYNSSDYAKIFNKSDIYLANDASIVQNEIVGWAFGTGSTTEFEYLYSLKNNKFYSYENRGKVGTAQTTEQSLADYIFKICNNEYKNWHDNYKTSSNYINLYLYAYYSAKPYDIKVEKEDVNGATPIYNKLNNQNFHGDNVEAKYNCTVNSPNDNKNDFELKSDGDILNVGLGSTVTVTLEVTSDSNEGVYSFGRLEFRNFPYKSTTYGTCTLVFLFTNGNVSSYYALNEKNCKLAIVSKDENKKYTVGDSTYNKIYFSSTSSDKIVLQVENCNLAANSFGGTLSDDTVKVSGSKGFVIRAFAVSNSRNLSDECKADQMVDKITITGSYNNHNTYYAYNKDDNNKIEKTIENNNTFIVVPLSVKTNTYNSSKNTATAQFWLNGSLKEVDKLPYDVTNKKFTANITRTITIHKPWNECEYDSSGNEITDTITIMIEGNYAYIPTNYWDEYSTDANNKITYYGNLSNSTVALPNYGNSQLIAIEPKQSQVKYAGETNDSVGGSTYWELESYISKIFNQTLDKPTKWNDGENGYNLYVKFKTGTISESCKYTTNVWYNYSDIIKNGNYYAPFNTQKDSTISNSPYVFTYCGTQYEIMYRMELNANLEANSSVYYLYFTHDANGKYMYFLVGVGGSNGKLADSGSPGVSIEFKKLESSITINVTNVDGGYGVKDDIGLDIYQTEDKGNKYYINGSNSYIGKLNPTAMGLTKTTENEITYFKNTISNVLPTNAYVLKFTPRPGYLIQSISLKIGNITVVSFTLDAGKFADKDTLADRNKFSLIGNNGVDTTVSDRVLITYGSSGLSNFKVDDNNRNRGIFYSTEEGGSWTAGYSEFETMFFYISNLYDNVTIDVETISYFEVALCGNRESYTDLFGTKGGGTISKGSPNLKLGKVLIGAVDGSGNVSYPTLTKDYQQIIYKHIGNGKYRILFFGLGTTFKNGLAILASGENYSYIFTSGDYYENCTDNSGETPLTALAHFVNGDGNKSTSSLSIGNNKENYLYVAIKDLKTFFDYGNGTYKPNKKILTYKYVLKLNFGINTNTIESKSWLYGSNYSPSMTESSPYKKAKDNEGTYQVDNPNTKIDTWFNDLTITNINFFNYYLEENSITSKEKEDNWQNVSTSGSYSFGSNNGYGIHIKYYVVPGYYLEKIVLTSSSSDVAKHIFGNAGYLTISIGKEASGSGSSNRVSYRFNYNCTNDDGAYFDIYIYGNGTTFADYVKNLGILSNSISIDIYSKQYLYTIEYYANLNDSDGTVSSASTGLVNGQKPKDKNNENGYDGGFSSKGVVYYEDVTYDRMLALTPKLTMTGYTFIGWGSELIMNGKKEDDRKWSSASSWKDVFVNNKDIFKLDNRNNLLNYQNYGYDFYVSEGYFITDTGFAKDNSKRFSIENKSEFIQSYNFWFCYADIFLKNAITRSKPLDFDEESTISLYAVWKANTYYVSIDVNDAISESIENENHTTNNTSTIYIAKKNGTEGLTVFSTDTIGRLILPGNLTNNAKGEYISYSNSYLDCYVTFDTKEWYVLERDTNDQKSWNSVPYSTFGGDTKKVLLKDYVIDRYGYTWLGWFSKKLDRVFEKQEYYTGDAGTKTYPIVSTKRDTSDPNESTKNYKIYGTRFYNADGKADDDFIKFEYKVYNGSHFKNGEESTIKEINSTHFTYKGESWVDLSTIEDENTGGYFLYNKVINNRNEEKGYNGFVNTSTTYTGKYLKKNFSVDEGIRYNSLNFIYFYDYKGNGPNIVEEANCYSSGDSLNEYNGNSLKEIDWVSKIDGNNKTKVKLSNLFTDFYGTDTDVTFICGKMYYDTMINYSFYQYVDTQMSMYQSFNYKPSENSINARSYRYLTLYGYWQTNAYTVIVDYNDSESGSTTLGIANGSTAVDKSKIDGKAFVPIYFDDPNVEEMLRKFLPIRLGYDFIGWTFAPGKTAPDNYAFDATNEMQNKLFKFSNLQYKNVNGNNDFDRTDIKEVLGDAEGSDSHFVYIFALWKAQTYSINVSLNIKASELKNLYDLDSEFALALYKTTDDGKLGYVGINSLFAMVNKDPSLANSTYSEIVANVVFEITFDKNLSTASMMLNGTKYYLNDLFATSAGYYFLGWLYGSSSNDMFVTNDTKSSFDSDGNLISGASGEFSGNYTLNDACFDQDLFKKLNSSYLKTEDGTFVYSPTNNKTTSGNNSNKLDNYETKKLEEIDYVSKNNDGYMHQDFEYTKDNQYYTTISSSSNASSNFGYILKEGKRYYISTEISTDDNSNSTYAMYYMDMSKTEGERKVYLYPVVWLTNESNQYEQYVANQGNDIRFTYDNSNFYIDGYVVRFYNGVNNTPDSWGNYQESEYKNAYYVNTTYGNSQNVQILLTWNSEKSYNNGDDYHIEQFSLTKTREFTLYAKWALKNDLTVNFHNGNNGSSGLVDSSNNPGQAGFYKVYSSHTTKTNKQDEKGISHTFNFYDNLDMLVSPYYNGRYMSEISIKFYSYQDTSLTKLVGQGSTSTNHTTTFKKVAHTLTLKFTWDSENHNITLDKSEGVYIDNENISLKQFILQPDDDKNTLTLNKDRESLINANSYLSKISLLNQDYDSEVTLLKISDYLSSVVNFDSLGSSIDYSSAKTTEDGRIDMNYFVFDLDDVMTSMDITCKFSVQTYKLEIYNVFDTKGNTFESISGTKNYKTNSYDSLSEFVSNSKSAYSSNGTFAFNGLSDTATKESLSLPAGSNGTAVRLATISTDSAVKRTEYNVPYGCYIYGQYYNQQLKPVDVEYNKSDRTGYDTSSFTGYDYIYDYEYYKYGASDVGINNKNSDGTPVDHIGQCYPILGSKTLFSSSVRETSALYTFVSWYMPGLDGNKSMIFTEYDQAMERTSFRNNITLVGYYYANNKPTSINFYTWSDSSNSYKEYTNNIDEYTLQSTTNSYAFTADNSTLELKLALGSQNYMTESGELTLLTNESFGVDVAKFGVQKSDLYTTSEIPIGAEQPKNKEFITNNLIRDYWFYRRYTVKLYVGNENDPQENWKYIFYDTSDLSLTHFYYIDGGNRQYVQLFSGNLNDNNFAVYAYKVSKESDKLNLDSTTFDSRKSEMIELGIYKDYAYDWVGSQMFVYKPGSDAKDDRYYKLNKIEDYKDDEQLKDNAGLRATVAMMDNGDDTYKARFYTIIEGRVYFMVLTGTNGDKSNVVQFYNYGKDATTGEYVFTKDTTLNNYQGLGIVNIDNYFLKVENDFYKVNYLDYKDAQGSVYCNPYLYGSRNETNYCDYVNEAGESIRYYFNYSNKTFYTDYTFKTKVTDKVLGTDFKVYTPVNPNYTVIIGTQGNSANLSYLGVNINTLPSPNIGFWYNNNTYGYIGYIPLTDADVSYIVSTVTQNFQYSTYPYLNNSIQNERIYDVLIKYIDALYKGNYTDKVVSIMYEKAKNFCDGYGLNDLLGSLITVGDFYTTNNSTEGLIDNIVTGVQILIPVTLKLDFDCDGKHISETLTVSVKYNINVISDSTSIEGTIYAIPIYSRNVVEFTENSITKRGTDSIIEIDTNQMYAIYFETISNMYTHYYSSQTGQDLKLIVLNEVQYGLMKNSNNYPDELTYLINKYNISPVEIDSNTLTASIGFADYSQGTYYVVAYYEKEDLSYVIRTSDNVVKVDYEGGIANATIIKNN